MGHQKIRKLTNDLKSTFSVPNEIPPPSRIEAVVDHFVGKLNRQNYWAATYFGCEFLSFIIVLGSFYIFDAFLDGNFISYGFVLLTEERQFVVNQTDGLIGPINILVNNCKQIYIKHFNKHLFI